MAPLPRIRDFDDPTYDPMELDALSFGRHDDPYPLFARMRAAGPVHEVSFREAVGLQDKVFGGRKSFCVVGYDEVGAVLVDPATYSNRAYAENLGRAFGQSITIMDAPNHTRWRHIFQKIFLPQYVAKWGDTIVDPVIDKLMSAFEPTGRADLVAQFTHLYPFHVIYEQLALPRNDIDLFQKLAIAQTDYVNMDKAVEAGEKLGEYFSAIVAQRRTAPGDDLITQLALTEVDGEYLPEDVLISFLRQLMNAAGDTTYRGTSVLLTALLQNPDQMDAIRRDRTLMAAAIEEALRWDGPVGMQTRLATKDVELGGTRIPAGSMVFVLAAAANRDPKAWPDPDRFDIFRPKKPHFSFARGPHMCVGQHLARVEMTRALYAVLDRLEGLRLDPDMPLPQLHGAMMRVPDHIHVCFAPR